MKAPFVLVSLGVALAILAASDIVDHPWWLHLLVVLGGFACVLSGAVLVCGRTESTPQRDGRER